MKPLDPRLLAHARATRAFLVAAVAIGAASALLIVAQAVLIAGVVVDGFQSGADLADVRPALALIALIAVGRAVLAWAAEAVGHRAAADATSQLRLQVVERALRLGPAHFAGQGPASSPRWSPAALLRWTATSPATYPNSCWPWSSR